MPLPTPMSLSDVVAPFIPVPVASKGGESIPFLPAPKRTLSELRVAASTVEAMVAKSLYLHGPQSSKALAEQLKLTVSVVREVIDELRASLLVTLKGTELVDFVFQLTAAGEQHARNLCSQGTYCGAVPVPLADYVTSVELQSIRKQGLDIQRFKSVLDDLHLPTQRFNELAQAMHAGRGVFLFGAPGNGKTSVAERLTACFAKYLWIPRTLIAGHEIIRLFDGSVHNEIDPATIGYDFDADEYDHRWVLIERPSIVVGGELALHHLELGRREGSHVLEAPIQMKSNGGTLVIDDFGRQRVKPEDLLNRWIIPLSNYQDYLSLPNGRQIQVPFDQNIVFSTNIHPRELVDEAFLRRIPFKVELVDPDEAAYREVFARVARQNELKYEDNVVEYLFETYYRATERPMRYCHPRDLLFHVQNVCELFDLPREVTKSSLDMAAKNYFNGM